MGNKSKNLKKVLLVLVLSTIILVHIFVVSAFGISPSAGLEGGTYSQQEKYSSSQVEASSLASSLASSSSTGSLESGGKEEGSGGASDSEVKVDSGNTSSVSTNENLQVVKPANSTTPELTFTDFYDSANTRFKTYQELVDAGLITPPIESITLVFDNTDPVVFTGIEGLPAEVAIDVKVHGTQEGTYIAIGKGVTVRNIMAQSIVND